MNYDINSCNLNAFFSVAETGLNTNVIVVYSKTWKMFIHRLVGPLKALYQSWVLDSERNILAILEDLPSLNPPIDHLCELLPRLQARYYSIASSSKVKPAVFDIIP